MKAASLRTGTMTEMNGHFRAGVTGPVRPSAIGTFCVEIKEHPPWIAPPRAQTGFGSEAYILVTQSCGAGRWRSQVLQDPARLCLSWAHPRRGRTSEKGCQARRVLCSRATAYPSRELTFARNRDRRPACDI